MDRASILINNGEISLDEIRRSTIRFLTSKGFIIPTKGIIDLKKMIDLWLLMGTCGAMIYGRPRIGKTFCINYICKSIAEDLQNEEAVVVWNVRDHDAVTEKNFYSELLSAMGFSVKQHSTALVLKERVLNELIIRASESNQRRVVLFLDEASLFREKDFGWLMDLYNNLMQKDIQLLSFLFGTRELKDLKHSLKQRGKDQIIGRFMVHECQYHGLNSLEELSFCLYSLDQEHVRSSVGVQLEETLCEFFFSEEYRFFEMAQDFWNAFQTVRIRKDILAEDIPMKYFIESFIICLSIFGKGGQKETSFPTKEDLIECVELSGYGESDDEYEKHKIA